MDSHLENNIDDLGNTILNVIFLVTLVKCM
jgi:hypothetical protein